MEASFWHSCWEDGRIGFHQDGINPLLQRFFERLQVPPGAHVLVPLCGKSLDMVWLAQRGYRVTGVELSRKAVEDFFAENALEFQSSEIGSAIRYSSGPIEIWCADFFSDDWKLPAPVAAVYDRAAVVALPPDMRQAHSERLAVLLEPGVKTLLVTLDYPDGEMAGPPFSVPQAEVMELFGSRFTVELLHSRDCLAREPRFKKRGVTRMDEHVYVITRN